jgi:hypothetical protein
MGGDGALQRSWLSRGPLVLGSVFLVCFYADFLVAGPVASVDLPGHVRLVEELSRSLLRGTLFFYDWQSYAGWPAFQSYGFLAYLLTVPVRLCATPFFSAPAWFAVNLCTVLIYAALPWSVARLASRLAPRTALGTAGPAGVATMAVVFTFWFLNLEEPESSVGVGATTGLTLGLYPQVWSWNIALWLVAAVYDLGARASRRTISVAALLLSALLFTHTLSFCFVTFFCLLLALCLSCLRSFLVALALTAGLAAFWLLTFLLAMQGYLFTFILPFKEDFFSIVLRYPVRELSAALWALLHGEFIPFNPSFLIVGGLLLSGLLSESLRHTRSLSAYGVALFGSLLFFSSQYVQLNLPLSLHYYRVLGILSLLLVPLVVAIASRVGLPADPQEGEPARWGLKGRGIIFWVVAALCFGGTALFPSSYWLHRKELTDRASFAAEDSMLHALRANQPSGRVLFEHITSSEQGIAVPHYMASEWEGMGRESVNGLILHTALCSNFVALAVSALHGGVYRGEIPITLGILDLPPPEAVARLSALGVSTVVGRSEAFRAAIRPFATSITQVDPYWRADLAAPPAPLLETVDRPMVGYLDRSGRVPFKSFELFHYARSALFEKFSIVDLGGREIPAAALSGLIVVGGSPDSVPQTAIPTLRLVAPSPDVLHHYAIPKEPNPERREFVKVEQLFLGVDWPSFTAGLAVHGPAASARSTPRLQLEPEAATLTDLVPQRWYHLHYSYYPLWKAGGAQLFRGDAAQMFVLPSVPSVALRFSYWNAPLSMLMCLISASTLILALVLYSRRDG